MKNNTKTLHIHFWFICFTKRHIFLPKNWTLLWRFDLLTLQPWVHISKLHINIRNKSRSIWGLNSVVNPAPLFFVQGCFDHLHSNMIFSNRTLNYSLHLPQFSQVVNNLKMNTLRIMYENVCTWDTFLLKTANFRSDSSWGGWLITIFSNVIKATGWHYKQWATGAYFNRHLF